MLNTKKLKINCTKCGDCCKDFSKKKAVIIFPQDVKNLTKALQLSRDKFISIYCQPLHIKTNAGVINIFTLKTIKNNCIFLQTDNLCEIYKDRPIQCQRAPFYFFWKGTTDFNYKCMRDISVPENWSSKIYDEELLNSLFNNNLNKGE